MSLQQLSQMKRSVISILGPEEHRVEESAILIDFFQGSNRIAEVYPGEDHS
jgi:hypothetical protein